MLKAILLSSLITYTSGQYTHWTDKAREFRCKNLERLYEKYRVRPLDSFTEKERQVGMAWYNWYDRNCRK